MRVALLPTGKMEWEGLAQAFMRLFPGHEFYCIPTRQEVEFNHFIEFPASSFTSCAAQALFGKPNNADKLLQRAVAEAVGDRSREAADLVVVLDDLELCNREQPAHVVQVVREGVQRQLNGLAHNQRIQRRHAEAFQARVSFHLAVPLIESWLFADPAGLKQAGVPETKQPLWSSQQDPEAFCTEDGAYLADTGASCTCWLALPEKKQRDHRPLWLKAGGLRGLHPKAYLSWLCLEGAERNCSSYDESKGGVRALKTLGWEVILLRPEGELQYLRALVADLADALQQEPTTGPITQPQASLTSRFQLPPHPVLRNL